MGHISLNEMKYNITLKRSDYVSEYSDHEQTIVLTFTRNSASTCTSLTFDTSTTGNSITMASGTSVTGQAIAQIIEGGTCNPVYTILSDGTPGQVATLNVGLLDIGAISTAGTYIIQIEVASDDGSQTDTYDQIVVVTPNCGVSENTSFYREAKIFELYSTDTFEAWLHSSSN